MASVNRHLKDKILSGIIIVMMPAALVLSSLYLAVEAGHECDGDECPICSTPVLNKVRLNN